VGWVTFQQVIATPASQKASPLREDQYSSEFAQQLFSYPPTK
jgi:hypothetical protein